MKQPGTTSDILTEKFVNPSTGEIIDNDSTPDFLNSYFATIAENPCDFTQVTYPTLDDNVDIRLTFNRLTST